MRLFFVLNLVFLLAACGLAVPAPDAVTAADATFGTRLVLLGTGTPNADPERSGPASAIVVNGTPYLVDFGPGVVRRAAAAHSAGTEGLAVERLEYAFLTHLHSDHSLGLADLLFTPWVLGRAVPLKVFGPPGVGAMSRHVAAAYQADVDIRLNGLEPANTGGWRVDATEVRPGLVYADENVRVTAFAVQHGSWSQAYGYRFDMADKSIVFSGDARPSESIVAACDGCDILVHEVYSTAGFDTRTEAWQTYHASFHTSSRELADLAKRARPGLLVLHHQLYWGTSDAELLAEIRRHYAGPVVSGRDLDVFD